MPPHHLLHEINCLPDGSCNYSIYQEADGDSQTIFFPMYKIQTIEFGDKNSNGYKYSEGYRKIKAIAKTDDNTTYIVYFIFDGDFYCANKCFETFDKTEKNLTPFHCSDIKKKVRHR